MNLTFIRTISLSIFLLLTVATSSSYAQVDTTLAQAEADGKSMAKLNLLGLPLNNFSFQYERAIGGKKALGLGFRFMPESGIPLASVVESLIDDPQTWNEIKDFRTSNIAFTPEIRFYLGKDVFRGFYVAPFARFARYTADLPFNFDVPDQNGNVTTEEIPLSGDLNTLTGGILIGAQWKLSKLIYLDWSILGPQYGVANGAVSGSRSLSAEEQDALRQELETLNDLPMVKTAYVVNNSGATVNFNGPWAGIRSSFSIGFRF